MKIIQSIIPKALLVIMTLGAFTDNLDAQEYWTSTGGCGYEDSISAPSLMPYIVLGVALTGGIIAIAVRHHGHHGHGHSHSHCHCH